MKKYYLLAAVIFTGVLFVNPVQAKSWLLDTTQTTQLILDNNLVLELVDWDKTKAKWNIELITQSDGQQKLGVYPSNKKVSYRLQTLSEQQWNYQVVGKDEWHDLFQDIEANKILLKPTSLVNNVLPAVVDNSQSADGLVKVLSKTPVTVVKAMGPVKNNDLKLISSIYQVSGAQADDQLEFSYIQTDNYSKQVYQYNQTDLQWEPLESYNDFPNKKITAKLKSGDVRIAIFSDLTAHDGIASFYDQSRYRYFNYQNGNFAASRDYPKGTKLKVTRLKTNESVIVEVNDYGPELNTGRLIDLDISAFKQIGSTKAGLIYVKVELYDQNP